jgi:hypothetical protein
MHDRELEQRLDAIHERGVHCADGVLRLSYDSESGSVALRAEGPASVAIPYERLSGYLGDLAFGATGQFGAVEMLLCAIYHDPARYGAVARER